MSAFHTDIHHQGLATSCQPFIQTYTTMDLLLHVSLYLDFSPLPGPGPVYADVCCEGWGYKSPSSGRFLLLCTPGVSLYLYRNTLGAKLTADTL